MRRLNDKIKLYIYLDFAGLDSGPWFLELFNVTKPVGAHDPESHHFGRFCETKLTCLI